MLCTAMTSADCVNVLGVRASAAMTSADCVNVLGVRASALYSYDQRRLCECARSES